MAFNNDGLSQSETTRLVARAVSRGRRWGISDRLKQDAVDHIDQVINDPEARPGVKRDCLEMLLKMEAMNQIDELKGGPTEDGEQVKQPAMILLLPPNGSEKKLPEKEPEDLRSSL